MDHQTDSEIWLEIIDQQEIKSIPTIMRRDAWHDLADPTRRKMIELLSEDDLQINDIADKFEISRPAVSKHLKILEQSDVIKISNIGRERICSLRAESLREVHQWVQQYEKFWLQKLDDLEDHLKSGI